MASISDLIHGKKPEVAKFVETDPIEQLQKLLRGEISSWDDITQLSNLYQDYMMGAYEAAIPGFADILSQGGADTLSLLQSAAPLIEGEIPEDVKSQVLRSSAFQSLMGGTAGSPMASALQARDLGLTSLDLMNKGANLLTAGGNSAQRWASLAQGTILPPTASMYSPAWFAEFQANQEAQRLANKQFQFNVEAAPDPAWRDRAELLASYGGMALGGGIGGGGKGTGTTMGETSWGSNLAQGTGVGTYGSPTVGAGYNFSPFNAEPAPAPFIPESNKNVVPYTTYW